MGPSNEEDGVEDEEDEDDEEEDTGRYDGYCSSCYKKSYYVTHVTEKS